MTFEPTPEIEALMASIQERAVDPPIFPFKPSPLVVRSKGFDIVRAVFRALGLSQSV